VLLLEAAKDRVRNESAERREDMSIAHALLLAAVEADGMDQVQVAFGSSHGDV
jgi:hypothetical protein